MCFNNDLIVLISYYLNIKILFVQNIIQLFFCSILLGTIHILYNYFGWTWQNITPGLFFISFFFGVQFNILNNIEATYKLR